MTVIRRVPDDEKINYMDLLLLADEQENMIMKYLGQGEMFAAEENGEVCGVCVVTYEENLVCEIKNIAVAPKFQRCGYGRKLLNYAENCCSDKCSEIIVGTGESPLTIPFYEKCGFVRSHTVKNFFTDNYDHPIFEDGVQLRDMVYFKKDLK